MILRKELTLQGGIIMKKISTVILTAGMILSQFMMSGTLVASAAGTQDSVAYIDIKYSDNVSISDGDAFLLKCENSDTGNIYESELYIEDADQLSGLELKVPDMGVYKVVDVIYEGNNLITADAPIGVTGYINFDWNSGDYAFLAIGNTAVNEFVASDSKAVVVKEGTQNVTNNQENTNNVTDNQNTATENTQEDNKTEINSSSNSDNSEIKVEYNNEIKKDKSDFASRIISNLTFAAIATIVGLIVIFILYKKGIVR